ncbi:MAG TPA: type II toxin-antitoxin system HicB family antitoxin [bacterium]|nr:type II toxin-antitoxin system HicB family antitoxin [bacterium]
MNTMTYKGYTARIEFDERDDLIVGHVIGLPDIERISFEGESITAAREDFHNAIEFYLAECLEAGKSPTKPASGKFMLRLPPSLHASLAAYAKVHGTSLNALAERALRREIEG